MTWKDERAVWNAAIFGLFPGFMGWDVNEVDPFACPRVIMNSLTCSNVDMNSLKFQDSHYVRCASPKLHCLTVFLLACLVVICLTSS